MSELIDQEVGGVESSEAAESATPLDSIFESRDAADVPASSGSEASADDFDRMVPHKALHRERERRRKMDARVRELEDEIAKYNEQKWGLDEEPSGQSSAQQDYDLDPDRAAAVDRYNKSLSGFTAKHGKSTVDAVEVAINRLTPEQMQEVLGYVGSTSDPVESIHAFVKRLGLLDGSKPLSIESILASKGKPQPAADPDADQRNADLSQREQAIHAAERRTVQAASRSEFVSEFGREAYAELDAVAGILIQNQDPAASHLQAAMQASPDPIRTAAELLHQWGMWSPTEAPAQRQQPQRPTVFPSNLAGARNVGVRNGPAWGGPSPLQDIFKRGRG